MSEPIKIKIAINKLDKSKFFQGKKDLYVDLTVWPSINSQYGDDFTIKQDLGKDADGKYIKGPIVGNGKYLKKRTTQPTDAEQEESRSEEKPIPCGSGKKNEVPTDDFDPPF